MSFTSQNEKGETITSVVKLTKAFIAVDCEFITDEDAVLFKGQKSLFSPEIDESGKVINSQYVDYD